MKENEWWMKVIIGVSIVSFFGGMMVGRMETEKSFIDKGQEIYEAKLEKVLDPKDSKVGSLKKIGKMRVMLWDKKNNLWMIERSNDGR